MTFTTVVRTFWLVVYRQNVCQKFMALKENYICIIVNMNSNSNKMLYCYCRKEPLVQE